MIRPARSSRSFSAVTVSSRTPPHPPAREASLIAGYGTAPMRLLDMCGLDIGAPMQFCAVVMRHLAARWECTVLRSGRGF